MEKTSKFKVGDKVAVIDSGSVIRISRVIVSNLNPTRDFFYSGEGRTYGYWERELEYREIYNSPLYEALNGK